MPEAKRKAMVMRKRKKTFYYTVLVFSLFAITIAILELCSPVALYFLNGQWVSRTEIQKTLDFAPPQITDEQGIAADSPAPGWVQICVLHPYLGFVYNYDLKHLRFGLDKTPVPVNKYGFCADVPLKRKSDDKIIIAIAGGSVAQEFFLYAADTLADHLKETPHLAGREIEILSLAFEGMKQPQQLMALNYFLALGGEFDIVINLDGYNEIVLPIIDNIPFGVYPYYPRSWNYYAGKALGFRSAMLVGRIYDKKDRLEKYRNLFTRRPFRFSNYFLAMWHTISKRNQNQQLALEEQLRKHLEKAPLTAQEIGPPYNWQSPDKLFADCAELWKRSSVQMWRVCQANEIAYFHFLQPNQYVAGTKTLTDWEKRFAFAEPDIPYRRAVEKGYRYLISAGRELEGIGLPFADLTGIFKEVTETIYKDKISHYNQQGNDILARRIANSIASGRPFSHSTSAPISTRPHSKK